MHGSLDKRATEDAHGITCIRLGGKGDLKTSKNDGQRGIVDVIRPGRCQGRGVDLWGLLIWAVSQ